MGCTSSRSSSAAALRPTAEPNLPIAQEQQTPPATTGLVVDCGSGHASVLWYRGEPSPEGVRQCRRSRLQVAGSKGQFKLADELAGGDSPDAVTFNIERACDLLEAEILAASSDDGLPTPTILFVGATGGLRDALATGSVERDALERFDAAMKARFAHIERVRTLCLSGAQEAAWELAAAREIWGREAVTMFPDAEANGQYHGFGLFSGGGQSMQCSADQLDGIAGEGGCLSWPFSTWSAEMDDGQGAPQEAWRDPVIWGRWEADLSARVNEERARLGTAAPLCGSFVLAAMNEVAAKASGFAEQPISAMAAAAKCRETMAAFHMGKGAAFDTFIETRKHYKYNVAR